VVSLLGSDGADDAGEIEKHPLVVEQYVLCSTGRTFLCSLPGELLELLEFLLFGQSAEYVIPRGCGKFVEILRHKWINGP
jgi:hypothetical protein